MCVREEGKKKIKSQSLSLRIKSQSNVIKIQHHSRPLWIDELYWNVFYWYNNIVFFLGFFRFLLFYFTILEGFSAVRQKYSQSKLLSCIQFICFISSEPVDIWRKRGREKTDDINNNNVINNNTIINTSTTGDFISRKKVFLKKKRKRENNGHVSSKPSMCIKCFNKVF